MGKNVRLASGAPSASLAFGGRRRRNPRWKKSRSCCENLRKLWRPFLRASNATRRISPRRGCGFTPIPTSVRFRKENTKHWYREHAQLERRHGGARHATGTKTGARRLVLRAGPVVLDLVNPIGTGRRLVGGGWKAGFDKAGRSPLQHAGS